MTKSKSNIPQYKYFNGKRYENRFGKFSSEKSAREYANVIRKEEGKLARVIFFRNYGKYWVVYERRK